MVFTSLALLRKEFHILGGLDRANQHRTEDAYKKNVTTLFNSLDRVEKCLAESSTPYLLSSPHVTEADVRLFTTIIRFDPVYVQHFKCNIRDSKYFHEISSDQNLTCP